MSTDIDDQEQTVEEFEGTTLECCIDYLTHDVPAEDWKAEADSMAVVTPDGRMDLYPLLMDSCLEAPQLSKWKQAFVWRLIEKYGDKAIVVEREWLISEALETASKTIIANWSDWDGEANQAAQQEQHPTAYHQCMDNRLGDVLVAMIRDIDGK